MMKLMALIKKEELDYSTVVDYLKSVRGHRGPPTLDTLETYRKIIKYFYKVTDGTLNIHLFDAYLIEQMKSDSTRRLYLSVSSDYLRSIGRSEDVDIPKQSSNPGDRITFLEPKELNRLIRTANGRDRLMVCLMGIYGLRTVEVERLRVGDYAKDRPLAPAFLIHGKGDKDEVIYLDPEDKQTINLMNNLTKGKSPGDPIIGISRRGIRKVIRNLMNKARIYGRSCHSLRHTAAMIPTSEGCPIAQVSWMLRHSRISTTESYYLKPIQRIKHNPAKYTRKVLTE